MYSFNSEFLQPIDAFQGRSTPGRVSTKGHENKVDSTSKGLEEEDPTTLYLF